MARPTIAQLEIQIAALQARVAQLEKNKPSIRPTSGTSKPRGSRFEVAQRLAAEYDVPVHKIAFRGDAVFVDGQLIQ